MRSDAEKVTTWKTKCARTDCKSASRPLSKYCTDWCGLKTASNRLEQASVDQLTFWNSVHAIQRPQAIIQAADLSQLITSSHQSHPPISESALLNHLRTQLSDLTDRRWNLNSQSQLVTSRLRYLRFSIHRWEKMCIETARALASQDHLEIDNPNENPISMIDSKTKKSSTKGKAKAKATSKKSFNGLGSVTGSNEAPCGFDVRLIWDDRDCEW